MYVLHDYKLVYLAQPRTASQAMAQLLSGLGAEPFGGHHNIDRGLIEKLKGEGYTIASGVRNHWDTFVSWWYLHRARRVASTFHQFVPWWMNEKKYMRPHEMFWLYAPLSTYIIRFETLQAQVDELLGEHHEIPKHNVSQRNGQHYSAYYNKYLRSIVSMAFEVEIEKYGYTFDDQHEVGEVRPAAVC